jgi:hypothetical protein
MMKTLAKKLLIAFFGVALSLVSYYCVNGWYNVIPWALAALAIGFTSKDRRSSIINGAVFGYFLFLVYIFAGYQGRTYANYMLHFILFDMVFSLVGAIACAVGAFVGNWVKGKIS